MTLKLGIILLSLLGSAYAIFLNIVQYRSANNPRTGELYGRKCRDGAEGRSRTTRGGNQRCGEYDLYDLVGNQQR